MDTQYKAYKDKLNEMFSGTNLEELTQSMILNDKNSSQLLERDPPAKGNKVKQLAS